MEESARNQLADLWVEMNDRQAVTDSVDELDQQLSVRPHRLGESRTPPTRIVFHGPIALLFEVDDDNQTVTVLMLKRSRRGP